MEYATRILFGRFPRTVASAVNGELMQDFVHSESEFDVWFDAMQKERDLYCSICRFRPDMRPVLDKVIFDFDSPLKESVFRNDISDKAKIEQMRNDESLAEEVLGPVWDDTQSLIRQCLDEDVPVITVFSGLGVHCHLLYKERVNPVREKVSTSMYFVEECDLDTWDRKVITDTRRVLRVPNSQRMVSAGNPAGVWNIPITENEVLNNTVHDLLERSKRPKKFKKDKKYLLNNRPEMEVKEGHESVDKDAVGTVALDGRDISEEVPDDVEWLVREFIPLPCIAERFLRSNPDHMVRFNGVVLLYQSGFSVSEVRDIIKKVGWVDYDKSITEKMTNQIWKRGYSESSCSKLQSLGLCVYGPEFDEFSNDPKNCDTYSWTSGDCMWK